MTATFDTGGDRRTRVKYIQEFSALFVGHVSLFRHASKYNNLQRGETLGPSFFFLLFLSLSMLD